MAKADYLQRVLRRGYISPRASEYGRMSLKTKARTDKCVICGWEGECHRYREKGEKRFNGIKFPRLCPNCSAATKGRGEFTQQQDPGMDRAAYRMAALQRLTNACNSKNDETLMD